MEAQALGDDDIRLSIEAALARPHEKFALSSLSWTAHGYTLKFRPGIVEVVRTAVKAHVFENASRRRPMPIV